jgi:hypothetical protein
MEFFMSEFTTIRDDIETPFIAFAKIFQGTTIGNASEADYKAALAELKSVGAADLEQAVKTIGVAILGGLIRRNRYREQGACISAAVGLEGKLGHYRARTSICGGLPRCSLRT